MERDLPPLPAVLWQRRQRLGLVTGQQSAEDTDTAAQEQEAGSKQQEGSLDNGTCDLSYLVKDGRSHLAEAGDESRHSSSNLLESSFHIFFPCKKMVAGKGFEPLSHGGEPCILPLDDPAINRWYHRCFKMSKMPKARSKSQSVKNPARTEDVTYTLKMRVIQSKKNWKIAGNASSI